MALSVTLTSLRASFLAMALSMYSFQYLRHSSTHTQQAAYTLLFSLWLSLVCEHLFSHWFRLCMCR
jgi:hypothetical protein